MEKKHKSSVVLIRSETVMTQCPLTSFLAYWTPPPTWPRRILCESKCLSVSLTRGCWWAMTALLLIYFVAMDVVLFARYRVTNLCEDSKAGHPGEIFSPFTHLSVKAILSDHVRHYVMTPTAEYANAVTGFSSIVTLATPNVISLAHLACAFVAGKFIASENLQDRQLGVVMYFFRTWLDSFDGTVFRARSGVHLQYNSVYSSWGYIVDGLIDTLGGCFLTVGVAFYLFKERYGPDRFTPALPLWRQGKYFLNTMESYPVTANVHGAFTGRDDITARRLVIRIVGLGLCLAVTGICWDRTVKSYTKVFQTEIKDRTLAELQFELSHQPSTLVLFFFWRFLSGQTVLTYIQVAIYTDKVMECMHYAPWVILSITIPLYVITVIYIQQMEECLQL